MRPRWPSGPDTLALVRHAESVGNLADRAARDSGAEVLDLKVRDADVELSDNGREQAAALGGWLETRDPEWLPTLVVASPYRRASDTAAIALKGLDVPVEYDDRLRERDLGALDGLTGAGIRARMPQEADRRDLLGKFYYEPPSGESWADVAQRVRSILNDLRFGYDGERVWFFTHQAVIMTFRYVLEDIPEADLLEVDRRTPIPNASVTSYRREGAFLELAAFAETAPVDRGDADVTREEPQAGRGDDG